MTLEARHPQVAVGHPSRAHRVVRDELRLCFLNLDHLAELGRLGVLAFADRLGVRFDEAEDWTRRADEAAGRDDLEAQSDIRSVRAKVLAQRGEFGQGTPPEVGERLGEQDLPPVSRIEETSDSEN